MYEYSLELKKIFKSAEKEREILKDNYVEEGHFVLSLLKNNSNLKNILNSYGVFYENFKTKLLSFKKQNVLNDISIYSLNFKKIIESACSSKKDDTNINSTMILLSIIEDNDNKVVEIFTSLKVNISELYSTLKNNNVPDNLFLNEISILTVKNSNINIS